jgi:uncharacterized protein (DUF433 family)
MTLATTDRLRFEIPLYTVADAARIVGVPTSTLATWAKGYVRRPQGRAEVTGDPVITYLQPDRQGAPVIPFVGLAESMVLAAVRRSGVPMQRIRPALNALEQQIGLDHALASRRLYTDGAELLFEYGERHRGSEPGDSALDLVVVRSGQRVFADVLADYLQRIEYGKDGYASLIHVPVYGHAAVVADPTRAFGAPIFERGGARVSDVLERFWAGESLDDLSDDFGVPLDEIEDVVRVASRRAA